MDESSGSCALYEAPGINRHGGGDEKRTSNSPTPPAARPPAPRMRGDHDFGVDPVDPSITTGGQIREQNRPSSAVDDTGDFEWQRNRARSRGRSESDRRHRPSTGRETSAVSI